MIPGPCEEVGKEEVVMGGEEATALHFVFWMSPLALLGLYSFI